MSDVRDFKNQPLSYRMGYIEGSGGGERNCYLLQDGANDSSEYERGYADGRAYYLLTTEDE